MANLSKFKIGGVVYNLKDAQGRQDLANLIAQLKQAAYRDVAAAISDVDGKIADAATVKAYVDAQVGSIHKFDVVVPGAVAAEIPAGAEYLDGSTKITGTLAAAEATMYKLYLVKHDKASAGACIEYITIRSGVEGAYTYAWEKIGSTQADLTGFVAKTTQIAGVQIGDGISVNALQEALGLGDLAYLDAGKVTVATADDLTMDSYTPAGNVTLNAFTQTSTAASLTKGDYTPAGSVTGEAIKGGSINVTLADAAVASDVDVTRADYTPAGDVTVTLKNNVVLGSVATEGTLPTKANDTFVAPTFEEGAFDAGELPSFTEGAFSQGTLPTLGDQTKSAFNTDAMKAHIAAGAEIAGDVDAETLILEAAATAQAVTDRGAFDAGTLPTKAADTWDAGALPSKDADEFTQGSFTEGAFTQGAMPTFNEATVAVNTTEFAGTKETGLKITAAKYNKQVVDAKEFIPVAASLGFSGTEAKNLIVTGVNYDKATANGASFAGTAEVLTGTINKSNKEIDVDFE